MIFCRDEEGLRESIREKNETIQELRRVNARLTAELGRARADAIGWEAQARQMDKIYRQLLDHVYPVQGEE